MAEISADVTAVTPDTPASGAASKPKARATGLHFERLFTPAGARAYDLVEWERRTAAITNSAGKVFFEQKDVEVPRAWSQLAGNIVAQKYLWGRLGTPERETSVRQLVDRVVDTLTAWGKAGHYFATDQDAETWAQELRWLLITQHAAFNSPVWFNIGVPGRAQQAAACFINSVDDTMESILGLARTEGMLFKFGSGTGSNLSVLRSSKEGLAGGGTASGPVSFMRGYDSFAGSIKSGGTTRRAAKMVILNADHPDILDFIHSKADEEKKAWALIEAGYEAGFNVPGGAYDSVQFQNANHSVRVTDGFMHALEEGADWTTRAVTDGRPMETMKAADLWQEIAEAAWICGDPGVQFDTTIQRWNTVPRTARINASNPCAEFLFVDDSACNLLSLNLRKFQNQDATINVERMKHAIDICFTAQEILVSNASYPTQKIAENSERLRPLGLGYANLGALLMSMGHAYDSPDGRAVAAAVTALMTGEAYAQSARMAAVKGPFAEFPKNREPMLGVMRKHQAAAQELSATGDAATLTASAREAWAEALSLGERYGYRNAQATVIAPTGTVGLMMDCDTTGIEPDLALVKYKTLVGGGNLKMVNATVRTALTRLGYSDEQTRGILAYVDANDTIEGAPELRVKDLPVFDCAFRPLKGKRSIAPMGHVRMMSAVQPFISGSQSKTVNLPTDATARDIADVYKQSWALGLKAIAIYRDGCKRSQPLSTSGKSEQKAEAAATAPAPAVEARPYRRRLPEERSAITHKFEIQGHEGYITVGMYPDGKPGEVFIKMAKEGSTISGLMDALATQTSVALQYGVPLEVMVNKFSHTRFEPAGMTRNHQIPIAKSLVDYIFRWLASRFLDEEAQDAVGVIRRDDDAPRPAAGPALLEQVHIAPPVTENGNGNGNGNGHAHLPPVPAAARLTFATDADAPSCAECGAITVRSGACYKCLNCGSTTGCG